MNVDYPFQIDGRGRTAEASDDEHINDLIEQVLLISPGERVNRPTFGSGVMQMVFAPNSDALAAAAQLSIQSSLQLWLGDLIQVDEVTVSNDDSTLRIQVQYIVRRNQEQRTTEISRAI